MRLRPRFAIIGAIALATVIVFLVYRWVDCGISIDYARREQEYQRARIELLRSLLRQTIEPRNLTRADVAEILHRNFAKQHVVNEYPDRIELDEVVFRFRDNRLADIVFLEELNERKR
jgi:hypothetical protein